MKVLSVLKSSTAYFLCHCCFSVVSTYSGEQRNKLPYTSLHSKGEGLTVLSAGLLGATYLDEVTDKFFWESFPVKKDRMFNLSIIPVPFPSE